MRSTALIPALGLGIALVVAVSASAEPLATSFQIRASLSAAQEVPTPTGNVSAASGSLTGTVMKEDSGAAISWSLAYSRLTGDAIAAHVHRGGSGQTGPIGTFLCGPCASPISGTARLDNATLAAIQNGSAYVNVHTSMNPAGEVRGQVAITADIRTTLAPSQEVPRPKGNLRRATGRFTAAVAKQSATGTVTWLLRFSGLTGRAVAAHIHTGRVGRTGPVAVSLCAPCRNGQRGTSNLSAATLAALKVGRAYVNVHTAKNRGGEIRGQIRAVPLTVS